MTPTQLYTRLLDRLRGAAEGGRRGRALPLRAGRDADPPRARRAAALARPRGRAARPLPDRPRHARPRRRLARGQRGRARAAAGRGDDRLRPAVALDPSRAPEGKSILWIQLQELPAGRVKGDAAGEIDVGDGAWTEDAARGVRRPDRRAARRVDREPRRRDAEARRRSPPSTSRRSTSTSSAATSTAARARSTRTSSGGRSPSAPGHETPVAGLWHIGASTHPGPGLGAGSGYLVAQELTKPPLPQRLLARLPLPGRA